MARNYDCDGVGRLPSELESMEFLFSPGRFAQHFLAIVFAACATVFSAFWIFQVKYSIPQPGFSRYAYSAATREMKAGEVLRRSPADQAGLRPGDRIVAIDGRTLDDLCPFYASVIVGHKEILELTVKQPGAGAGTRELKLRVGGGMRVPPRTSRLRDILASPIDYYPVGFLVVGVAVLLLRPDDRNAWLLAFLFGSLMSSGPLFEGNIPPPLRGFILFYKIVMSWASLAIFYCFFAVFPASSPIDRRIPWLKYLLLAATTFTSVPVGVRCLIAGGTLPLYLDFHWPGATLIRSAIAGQAGLPVAASHLWSNAGFIYSMLFPAEVALGLASLTSNAFLSADAQVRRKARVMVSGTFLGIAPVCLVAVAAIVVGFDKIPMTAWQISVLLLLSVLPLSFAYAVVKHRVLEIPVLLKRSARYLLVQRGYFLTLAAMAAIAIVAFTATTSRLFRTSTNIGMAVSALFGIMLVWVSAPVVKRGTERIDRAFFRSAYDARVILESLAEKARAVSDRHELTRLLQVEIEGALHPTALACYLESDNGGLVRNPIANDRFDLASTTAIPNLAFRFGEHSLPGRLDVLPANLPLLRKLAEFGKAWSVPHEAELVESLTSITPECVVPILGHKGHLLGLLVLGARLSEEPYSREDKQLLDSVASQTGITLENIRLAEQIAEGIETERRNAIEMEIARRVQARLFPQKLPLLETLEYAGGCVQAREIGGDYYDFLDMRPGALGIVLADISGKGISAALLMANLQANLRSQYAIALDDMQHFLQSVNHLFFENTTEEAYATMFFGIYEDSRRTLRFCNCGHVAPFILRTDGRVRKLTSTTTVLGLFVDWQCQIEEEKLCTGDLLVICTDGVTEAPNPQGEEYGDTRLAKIVRENSSLSADQLVAVVQSDVQQFTNAAQADDITLIVARCR